MKKLTFLLRWLLSILFFMYALIGFEKLIAVSTISFVCGLISLTVFDSRFSSRSKILRILRWIVTIIGFIYVSGAITSLFEAEDKKLDLAAHNASELIDKGDLSAAQELLQDLIPKYHTSQNKAAELMNEIQKSSSQEYLNTVLLSISNKSFEDLKSGVLDTSFFKQKTLNQNFKELILSNEKDRLDLLLDKKQAEDQEKIKLAQKERNDRIDKLFSSWNGSHIGLVEYVKKGMHDPESFKHVETKVADKGNHLIVIMTYRGRNGFGALMKEQVKAKCDLEGGIIQVYQ